MKTEEIAKELIKYETVSPVEEPQVFEFLKQILKKEGVDAEIRQINGTYNLVAETGTGDVSVCLNGHLDVVEPEGEWSVTEPFEPKMEDGKLYGRGATDMKSETAALVKAFIDLHNDSDFEGSSSPDASWR
jgi:Acetylornithine deacetylase/Succinyl-diaminopimelate desuccinylase and related deacylases